MKITEKILGKNEEISLEGDGDKAISSTYRYLLSKEMRAPLLTGLGLSIFQQITGINAIFHYAPRIFQLAGFTYIRLAIFIMVALGIVNLLMTITSLWLIDRVGRRPLLITGLIGMSISLFILGISFLDVTKDIGMVSVITLIAYVGFFALSLGPITWIIISEIFPLKIRGRAIGLSVFANWMGNYIVSFTFLHLIVLLSPSITFWLYTLITLFAIWFVSTKVPETKNKSLQEIEAFWKKKKE